MFTVEMDTDNGESVTITTLDASGKYDDVKLVMFDEVVFLSQQDDHEMFHSLIFSTQQWHDLIVSMQSTEGAYYVKQTDSYT